jgi:hypothetical protein
MLGWLRCLFRRHHVPLRHPLGGFRCTVCGLAGADLEVMGFKDSAYVSLRRPLFKRHVGNQIGAYTSYERPWDR